MKSQFNIAGSAMSISAILFLVATVIKGSSMEYSGDTLVRNTRAVSGMTDGNETDAVLDGVNLTKENFDEDYPVVFNILLWLGVSLAIATLSICVAIGSMDPGRDSLIYRVTSAQRFKKDN